MRRFIVNLLVSIFLALALTSTAYANSALELLKDIEVHGFASSSYSYNFNKPSDNLNDLRVYDDDDNSFKFDTGELVFKKDACRSEPVELYDFISQNIHENTHFGNLPTLREFQKTIDQLQLNLELKSIA